MKVVLENLTKKFPSRNKKAHQDVIAVNDFSFEIPDGKLAKPCLENRTSLFMPSMM